MQVLDEVCRVANWLKSVGVQKGDAVAIYMPMHAELPIAMLACARIGAVHSVVFGGFSADALAGRMADCKAKVLITSSAVMRGPKRIDLKKVSAAGLSCVAGGVACVVAGRALMVTSQAASPARALLPRRLVLTTSPSVPSLAPASHQAILAR